MEHSELFEVDSIGDHYTWHNKLYVDPIYSRIDRALGNMAWLQAYCHLRVEIMDASISDHALLRINLFGTSRPPRRTFKFINKVIDLPNFMEIVRNTWNEPVRGRGMYIVWRKMGILRPVLQHLQNPSLGFEWNSTKHGSH